MPNPNKKPKPVLPNEGGQAKPAPAKTPGFGETLYGQTYISNDAKNAISALADKAKSGNAQDIQAFHDAVYNKEGATLPQELKDQLANYYTYGPAPAKKGGKRAGGGGGGGGRRGGGGGGGGTTHGETSTQPLVQESKNWALDVLKGKFESNPWLNQMMDPANLDVRNNPNLKPVVDAIQREGGQDLLRNLWQADAQAEQLGRPGSGYSAALRMQREHDTNQSVNDALSRVYAGAYENEANRQAGLMPTILGTQTQAAGIPIQYGQLDVARGQLGVARGQLGLARSQFGFEKKMALANAQQDALNDYMNILIGIGGLGGTTTESQSGSYQPSMGAWEAALMSGMGSALESYGQQNKAQT